MAKQSETYFINEANGDRHAGSFKTYKAACAALARNYDEDDLERCQPCIGMERADGSTTYEL
jgi:hypothetical protein